MNAGILVLQSRWKCKYISRSSSKQIDWVDISEISISKFIYKALAPIGIAINTECYCKSNGSPLLEGFPIKSNSLVESIWKEFWIMVQSTAVVPANTGIQKTRYVEHWTGYVSIFKIFFCCRQSRSSQDVPTIYL